MTATEVHPPHAFYRVEIYDQVDQAWVPQTGPFSHRASAIASLEGKRQGNAAWVRNNSGHPEQYRLTRETRTFTLEPE